MKEYSVRITHSASADMDAIYDYIAHSLLAPDTAAKQYDRIADGIMSLNIFPERCKLFDSQPERDMGFRQLLVDHYSVIYVVEDDIVTILRVLYSASDINTRLRENHN